MIRGILSAVEIAILSVLILRRAAPINQDVFFAGNIYFTDADCYARMTRVRMCSEHPGLIVRHHGFENSPTGTTPHTTAPLDYLILALSILLTTHGSHNRCGRRAYFTVARAAGRLVSLVLVREVPLSLGPSDPLRDQSYSRSWNRARQARPSIAANLSRDDRNLCGMEPASTSSYGCRCRTVASGASSVESPGDWRSGSRLMSRSFYFSL